MTKPTIRELLDDVRSDVDSTHEMAASKLAERVEAVLKFCHENKIHGLHLKKVLRLLDGE